MIEFNLNKNIVVELTENGKRYLIAERGILWLDRKHIVGNWYKFQGHQLFELFPEASLVTLGHYMHMKIKLIYDE